MLTVTEVQESLPISFRQIITEDVVDKLNNLSADPLEAKHIRDNFVTFTQVLSEGRFKMNDYVKAVIYVSHKLMGKTNLESYKNTFPARYEKMVARGMERKNIASMVSAYNKGILVNKIAERAMIPVWVLNQDMFQKALNVNYSIMEDVEVSPKVRVEAANSILTHLKKPEVNKAELSIEIGMNDGMAALEEKLTKISEHQLKTIEHQEQTVEEVAASEMKLVN